MICLLDGGKLAKTGHSDGVREIPVHACIEGVLSILFHLLLSSESERFRHASAENAPSFLVVRGWCNACCGRAIPSPLFSVKLC